MIGLILAVFLIVLFIIICWRHSWGVCTAKTDLTGKTVIITGCNTGIGYYVALDLAFRNARIVMACRNAEKANAAKEKIIAETGNKQIVFQQVNLSSLQSVRQFTERIINEESHLDILINNAGIIHSNSLLTEDGLNTIYCINHFAPFLLTNLLLDLLQSSAPSRVINVSSHGHKIGSIRFENMKCPMLDDGHTTYANTKLANVLFTRELARRTEGKGISTFSVHPGFCDTELFRFMPSLVQALMTRYPLMKTAKEGAQTILHCALSEGIESTSGEYYADCKVSSTSANGRDMAVAKKLWEVSETLSKLLH